MPADTRSLTAFVAGVDDLAAVRAIRLAAAADLTSRHGPGGWSRVHTLHTLRKHQAERAVLVVASGPNPVATFTLARAKPGFYHQAWFADPRATAVYVSNMAVLPA